jgi:hypothetical protein
MPIEGDGPGKCFSCGIGEVKHWQDQRVRGNIHRMPYNENSNRAESVLP